MSRGVMQRVSPELKDINTRLQGVLGVSKVRASKEVADFVRDYGVVTSKGLVKKK